jgi:hypothetical protein
MVATIRGNEMKLQQSSSKGLHVRIVSLFFALNREQIKTRGTTTVRNAPKAEPKKHSFAVLQHHLRTAVAQETVVMRHWVGGIFRQSNRTWHLRSTRALFYATPRSWRKSFKNLAVWPVRVLRTKLSGGP